MGNIASIEISHLTRKFGALTAVNDLSLEIQKGEIFGFLGPNGAGKTTTINMICGLLPPTSGFIKFHQSENNGKDLKSKIGYCPQENIFWQKLTPAEQMIFMAEMHGVSHSTAKERSAELLKWLGLDEKADTLACKLSGGMKRRLSICLALVHDPEIIILDEPEAGLDPQSRLLVRNAIKSLAGTKTVVLTTHNMDEADRLSHRVAIIDHGKLLKLDSPENLKKSIGEGDILEIAIFAPDPQKLNSALRKIAEISDSVKLVENNLIIRRKNILEKIPDFTTILKNPGITINEITLRENTLEDVFIHLTGRKLRQ